jgi:hypothetical protein
MEMRERTLSSEIQPLLQKGDGGSILPIDQWGRFTRISRRRRNDQAASVPALSATGVDANRRCGDRNLGCLGGMRHGVFTATLNGNQ